MTAKKKTTRTPKAAPRKRATKPKTASKTPKLKAGDVVTRTFKGKAYRLRVTNDGFALGKQVFPSLTAAARHVTKYASVSGPRFWLGQSKGGGAA